MTQLYLTTTRVTGSLCNILSSELCAFVKWLNLNFLFLNFSKIKFISDTLNIKYEDHIILKSENDLFLDVKIIKKLTLVIIFLKFVEKTVKLKVYYLNYNFYLPTYYLNYTML